MSYDPELALHHLIAGLLDKPSVYMGGPSKQNMRRAEEIVKALRCNVDMLAQLIGHPVKTAEVHQLRNGETRWTFHQECGCPTCRQVYDSIEESQRQNDMLSLQSRTGAEP